MTRLRWPIGSHSAHSEPPSIACAQTAQLGYIVNDKPAALFISAKLTGAFKVVTFALPNFLALVSFSGQTRKQRIKQRLSATSYTFTILGAVRP